jgi:Fic family protein
MVQQGWKYGLLAESGELATMLLLHTRGPNEKVTKYTDLQEINLQGARLFLHRLVESDGVLTKREVHEVMRILLRGIVPVGHEADMRNDDVSIAGRTPNVSRDEIERSMGVAIIQLRLKILQINQLSKDFSDDEKIAAVALATVVFDTIHYAKEGNGRLETVLAQYALERIFPDRKISFAPPRENYKKYAGAITEVLNTANFPTYENTGHLTPSLATEFTGAVVPSESTFRKLLPLVEFIRENTSGLNKVE